MTRENGRRRRWLRLLFPLLLLVAIAWLVDLDDIARALFSLSPGVLLAALLLATLDRGLMAFKWRQLVRAGGGHLRFLTTLRIYYQASASGRVIPFPLGAEVLRAYLAARERVSEGLVASSIVIERLIALLASAVLALLGLVYLTRRLPADVDQAWFYGLIGVGITVILTVLFLILASPEHGMGRRAFTRFVESGILPRRVSSLLRDTSVSLLRYRAERRALGVHGGLAVLEQILQYAKLGVLGYGVGITTPVVPFIAIIALTLFVRRVAGSVEQWGVGEGSAVLSLVLLGIESGLAVAMLVANFAVSTIALLPGVALFYTHPVPFPGRRT